MKKNTSLPILLNDFTTCMQMTLRSMYGKQLNESQLTGTAHAQTLIIPLSQLKQEVTQAAFSSDRSDSEALGGVKISMSAAPYAKSHTSDRVLCSPSVLCMVRGKTKAS